MSALDRYAKSTMMIVVGFILILALLIAGIYFVLLTPGEANQQPSPHAIDQNPA